MTGEVKSYSVKHGYGFITKDGKDYRFKAQDWTLRYAPVQGITVEFDPVSTDKGYRARNIRKERM